MGVVSDIKSVGEVALLVGGLGLAIKFLPQITGAVVKTAEVGSASIRTVQSSIQKIKDMFSGKDEDLNTFESGVTTKEEMIPVFEGKRPTGTITSQDVVDVIDSHGGEQKITKTIVPLSSAPKDQIRYSSPSRSKISTPSTTQNATTLRLSMRKAQSDVAKAKASGGRVSRETKRRSQGIYRKF